MPLLTRHSIPVLALTVLLVAACASQGDQEAGESAPVEMPFPPSLVSPAEAQLLDFAGTPTTMLYHGNAPDGGVSTVEMAIAPKTLGAPPHTHTREDEYFYVAEGEITFQVGDEEHTVPAGSYGAMPRGLSHAFWNGSEKPARVLLTIAPGAFASFFEEVSSELRKSGLTDRDAIGKLVAERAAKYGCAVHGDRIGPIVQKYGLR